jgi:uncharacterized protein
LNKTTTRGVIARVGVVADTHCPEFMAELPSRLFNVLSGVDLILHAGDVNGQSTLDELQRIAPVEAVRGDHDHALTALPIHREITIGGKRVVVVHGDRSRWIEEPETLLWTLSLGHYRPHKGLPGALRRRFPEADVIVYGHTHRPRVDTIGGAVVFNPGGVHQWNRETTRARLKQRVGWFEWCWLQVARHLRVHQRPSVGLLELDGGRIVPKVIEL